MSSLPKIFCISLKDQLYRIESCKKEFEKSKLDFQFFYGIDGSKTNLKVITDNTLNYTQMNSGRIGCFLSHYMLWNHILYSDYEEALILEDDFEFVVSFEEVLNYKKDLPNEWDLFFIGYCCETNINPITENIATGDGICTHAYFINKKSIQKIITDILPVDLPIDMKLKTLFSKLKAFYSVKKCVINKSLEKLDGFVSITQ